MGPGLLPRAWALRVGKGHLEEGVALSRVPAALLVRAAKSIWILCIFATLLPSLLDLLRPLESNGIKVYGAAVPQTCILPSLGPHNPVLSLLLFPLLQGGN